MAALIAILKALRRAVLRDLRTFRSIKVNNFFIFVALLIWAAVSSGVEPVSAEPLIILLALVLLFPLSTDPLRKIPAWRLRLWPLTRWQRVGLRAAAAAVSPIVWIAAALLLTLTRPAIAFAFLVSAAAIHALVFSTGKLRAPKQFWIALRHIARPPGRLGSLILLNTRQMLTVLDTYLAIVLSVGATAYRFFTPHPDAAAFPIMAILVALTLSTYAQALFSLDRGPGVVRYRLLPLCGWQILLAKDAAFLGILFILVLPLSVPAGLTFGLAALAVGHHVSVFSYLPLQRWRFAGGRLLPAGIIQIVMGAVLAMAEQRVGLSIPWVIAAVDAVSIYAYGGYWDRAAPPRRHAPSRSSLS
ncbi:MAG: hypothetical protein ABI165_02200 [Bryobacteraceae bacterium]